MIAMQTRVLTRNVPKIYTSRIGYRPAFTQRFIYMKDRITTSKSKVVTKMSVADIEYASYLVGKSIILFTMFYCTLNWWHYRQINKQIADEEKNENGEKDNMK